MINIKGGKDYLVALESVAMTDIVLNMFIFFFISFSLLYTFSPVRMSKLEIKLPKAETAVKLEGSEKIMLSITKMGAYFIDGHKVNQASLKVALNERIKEMPQAGVLLQVDSLSRFDRVAKALDVINELDIKKVSVATTQGKIK